MRIEIPVYDGFDEVDAIAPYEVLSNVQAAHPDVEVELVGAHGPGEILASHGLRMTCTDGLSDRADLVLVPGGGWSNGGGVRDEYERGALAPLLAQLYERGAVMASVCTGAMLLGQAGILTGRPATTHRAAIEDLRALGVLVDDTARVVDDGDVLTCGGVTSGLDLAFHLVEREWGAQLADRIATLMEHERRGPVRVTSRRS